MALAVITDKHALVVTTVADKARDWRVERFWEVVCELIFDEGRSQDWKRAALARYARMLGRKGDGTLADLASRLAESYEDSIADTTHWSCQGG